jgi:WhiB family redox-sensing transcriptional regulator
MRDDYVPLATDLDWVHAAACRGMDPDDFFVEAGRVIDESVLDVCQGCAVRLDCLEYAYRRNFPSGYFGGLSPGQRRALSLKEARRLITRTSVKPPQRRRES